MFDSRGRGAAVTAAADSWVPSDAELAELVGDRGSTERPARVVVAAAEHAPITPQLIADLEAVDPAALDDDGRVGLAVAWARVRNHVDAQLLSAIAAFGGDSSDDPTNAAAFAWAEIGATLRLGDGAAADLVHVARALRDELPATLAAMAAGDVSLPKARALVELTPTLTPQQRATVESRVLPHAPGRTPARHRDAVRRAVDRIDPEAMAERRRQAAADVALIRTHRGDGMGELFALLPSEDLDTVWLGADTWARRRKSAGDKRTLAALRVAALTRWAESFLIHGDSTVCDTTCTVAAPTDPVAVDPLTGESATFVLDRATGEVLDTTADAGKAPAPPVRPTRHGRPVVLNLCWDLTSYLGLTDHPGEILDSGALLPAEVMRDLARDADVRRLLTDPLTGHLLDATPGTYRPGAALSAFIALRDVAPTTPTAGAAPAGGGDLDHVTAYDDGGGTTRSNLHSPTRRWHRAKTYRHWTVKQNPDGSWTWTSAHTGRAHTVAPHDYRLGP